MIRIVELLLPRLILWCIAVLVVIRMGRAEKLNEPLFSTAGKAAQFGLSAGVLMVAISEEQLWRHA